MRIVRPPFDYAAFEAQLKIFLPCQHPNVQPRRRMKSNRQFYYKMQCPDCGKSLSNHLSFELVKDFRQTWGPIKNWDYAKESDHWKRRNAVGEILRANLEWQRNAAWWAQYEAYLLGPEWRVIRNRVLRRAAGRCERCAARPPAEVHHLTYERVGEEEDRDLLGVCVPCHCELHPDRAPRIERLNSFVMQVLGSPHEP